jgi:hypothetical protein
MNVSRMRLAVFAVVAAVAVTAAGLLGKHHEQNAMRRGIDEVRVAIGPSLTRPGPTDYLYSPGRTCLLYGAGGVAYALELCIDSQGRVVEAVDRRGSTPRFYSIVEEPGASPFRISPTLFASLVEKVQRSVG